MVVHPGSVLGADGFGYVFDGQAHRKIPQVGRVVVEDDVEIGANVTVDRATLGETVIGRGTKIDNLVQIGHNTVIGARLDHRRPGWASRAPAGSAAAWCWAGRWGWPTT